MNSQPDISKVNRVYFIDTDDNVLRIEISEIEKDPDSPCNIYTFRGKNGAENCSGNDVAIEFRFMKNKCYNKNCCHLPKAPK